MLTLGLDSGSRLTKAVLLEREQILGWGKVPTGFDHEDSARKALSAALEMAGKESSDIQARARTGAVGDSAEDVKKVNPIQAMAHGALYHYPEARTVVDVGAEMGCVARVDEKGRVADFSLNDKCAAGSGAFIEAMARALEVGLTDMGALALAGTREISMNSQCAIFAESDVVGLIHARTSKEDISKAIHDSIASRIVSLVRGVGLNPPVAMVGGVGQNPGFVESLRRQLKVDSIQVAPDPELGAALGAALLAGERR